MAYGATDRTRANGRVSLTLLHEYVLHFMFQDTRAAYPAWYVEGFAEYLSTATFAEGAMSVGTPDKGRACTLGLAGWLLPPHSRGRQRLLSIQTRGASPPVRIAMAIASFSNPRTSDVSPVALSSAAMLARVTASSASSARTSR